MIAFGTPFTSPMGVIYGIFRDASCRAAKSQPAHTARLAPGDVFLIGITDLTNGSAALSQYSAQFAGGQLEQRIVAFFGHQLGSETGAPHQLSTLPDLKLDIVQHRAH